MTVIFLSELFINYWVIHDARIMSLVSDSAREGDVRVFSNSFCQASKMTWILFQTIFLVSFVRTFLNVVNQTSLRLHIFINHSKSTFLTNWVRLNLVKVEYSALSSLTSRELQVLQLVILHI